MGKNYTLEDVETLRSRAGVSYEEAVSLLDKYDGDVPRALIELEKRGQLGAGRKSVNVKFNMDDVSRLWTKGLNTRVIVERGERQLIDLSVLVLALMLVLGPYAFVAAVVLVLVCGCKVSLQTEGHKPRTVDVQMAAEPEAQNEEADAAPAAEQAAEEQPAEEKKDGDFPSITIE